MPKLASYNGKVDSIENIKVSPMSRAFLFSDSVYEVISFYKNQFIDFDRHLDRLKHSLNETKISCSIDDCKTEIEKLLSESKSEDGYMAIINDEIMQKGSKMLGFTIAKISESEVRLKRHRDRITLELIE